MPDNALERALDDLYAADPDTFVSSRRALVADLHAAGDRAGANQLKAARRPSTSAWALNQLARRQPQLIATLLERSNELRAAQSRPGTGPIDEMQAAIRAHRHALTDATDAALDVLGPRANDSFRTEILSSLRAASTDPEVGHQLERGRLVREAEGASGFPDATHLTLVPDVPTATAETAPPTPAREKPARERPAPHADRAAGREAARLARESERAAEREARRHADLAARDEALERVAAADADAGHAEARIELLAAELDEARRALQDARVRSRKAQAEATRLAARLD